MAKSNRSKRYEHWIMGVLALFVLFVIYFEGADIKKSEAYQSGYLEGTGDMLFSVAAGVLSLLVRIACSYGFRPVFGNMVVAYAEAFSWIFLLAMFFLRYVFRQRKPKRGTGWNKAKEK